MPLIAEVNVAQFVKNITTIRSKTYASIMAVVKADAYAHGSVPLALNSQAYVDEFAVADFNEATELVNAGIVKPINILSPIEPLSRHNWSSNMVATVCSLRDVDVLRRVKMPVKFVNIEVNTGMNRLGIELGELLTVLEKLEGICIRVKSIFSHLYNATDLMSAQKQLEIFKKIILLAGKSKGIKLHLAASSCMHLPEEFYFDCVRPGIGLYGYADGTLPILKIYAGILKIFAVKKGEAISYGDYKAPRDMLVAAVRAGYADGIKRKIDPSSENRFMSIGGNLCPIVGQVCMDITMIDVSKIAVNYSDKVYVLGNGVTADMLACDTNTNIYEVLTAFKGRVERKYYS